MHKVLEEEGMTTPTPRTDARCNEPSEFPVGREAELIPGWIDFARQLERELAAAQEALKAAEERAESYRNPPDEAISASFTGLVETQDVLGQIQRRSEFKRRYLLVIAAIDAAMREQK